MQIKVETKPSWIVLTKSMERPYMGMDGLFLRIKTNTKDSFTMGCYMAKVNLPGTMVLYMRESSPITKSRVKVYTNGQMVPYIQDKL